MLSLRTLSAALVALTLTFTGCSETQENVSFPQSDLQARLDALKAKSKANMPVEVASMVEVGVQDLINSHITDRVPHTGDEAIDFTLPDATGGQVSLNERLKNGPAVLIWYRGAWCPFCNIQLHAYQEYMPFFKKAGAQLIAISPQTPDATLSTKEKMELDFDVLSDQGNKVARQYGLVYKLPPKMAAMMEKAHNLSAYNGDNSQELPLTVVFVVNTDGKIVYDFISADFRKRAEPYDVMRAIQKLKHQS